MKFLFIFCSKMLFVTLGLYSLALQAWGQGFWEVRNTEQVVFEALDSVTVPGYWEPTRTYYNAVVARDSVFLICRPLCDSCNFIQVYDLKGKHLTTITLETKAVNFDNKRDLPAWTGLWYFFTRKEIQKRPPKFETFYIAPNYIYAQNTNYWAIFSKTGKLLSQGYWRAYTPSKDTCYTSYSVLLGQQFASIQGQDCFFIPIRKDWPEFWTYPGQKKNCYEYHWNFDFYDPQNYFLAKYEIPKPQAGKNLPQNFSDGIPPSQALVRLNKDWGKLKRRVEATFSSVAVDSVRKLLYVAIRSEHQVRIYDWEGNFMRWVGEKGKHLAPQDTFLPIPSRMAGGIDTMNFNNWNQMLEEYRDLTYSMYKASYQYYLCRLDPIGGYLFRIYAPPDNAYKAYAKGVGVFPGFQSSCRQCKEYLQIISLKTGKVVYDEELSRGNKYFDILQINASADYWIYGGYNKEDKKHKLYRVKMTVKGE
jgi:hypothetical protein